MNESIVFAVVIVGIAVLLVLRGADPSRPERRGAFSSPDETEPDKPIHDPWGAFAARHRLTFKPGGLLTGGARMYGVYRGHQLEITEIRIQNDIYITAVVDIKDPSRKKRAAMAKEVSGNPAFKNVLAILAPDGLHGISGEFTSDSRQILYTNSDVLADEQVGRICHLLSDLGDEYLPVVAMGGEVAPALQTVAGENSLLRGVVVQMLKDIAGATQSLASRAGHLLCPRCLVRCHVHRANLPLQPDVTYYGCRLCRQSQKFIDCPQGVAAVLDTAWRDEQSRQDDMLRVNWLTCRALFDFDWVEIVRAADKDVEQFAIQVGNDTDPIRKPHYAQMRCVVNPRCGLSENTLRILENTFGQVQQTVV